MTMPYTLEIQNIDDELTETLLDRLVAKARDQGEVSLIKLSSGQHDKVRLLRLYRSKHVSVNVIDETTIVGDVDDNQADTYHGIELEVV